MIWSIPLSSFSALATGETSYFLSLHIFGIRDAFAENTGGGYLTLVQCSWDMSGLWRLSIPPLLSLDSTAAVYTAACSTNANLCLSKFLGFPSAQLMTREWRRRVRHDSPLFSAVRTVQFSAANDALPKSLTASSQQHNRSWNLVCHCLLLISRLDESPSTKSTISK